MRRVARSRGRSTHPPAMEGKPVRHSFIQSVPPSAPVDSLLALSTTHGGGRARDSCFCLINRRSATTNNHDDAAAAAIIIVPSLHLHLRLSVAALPAPAQTTAAVSTCAPFSFAHLSHTPIARPSPGSSSSARAREELQVGRQAHLLLTCRAVIIVALRTRKACLYAALSAPSQS